MEENVCLLQEPDSVYLGNITPNTGSSSNIVEAMWHYFAENDISLSSLIAVP